MIDTQTCDNHASGNWDPGTWFWYERLDDRIGADVGMGEGGAFVSCAATMASFEEPTSFK